MFVVIFVKVNFVKEIRKKVVVIKVFANFELRFYIIFGNLTIGLFIFVFG